MTGKRLADRVALITGAGGGIGGEAAVLFAAEGARVVVVDVNEVAGHAIVEHVHQAGGKALFVRADVSREVDCARMVAEAERAFGKLDVLFNNAGIMDSADDDATRTSEEVWERTVAINLKGVFLGCKYGIPRCAAREGARSSTLRPSLRCSAPRRRSSPTRRARAASWR